MKTKTENELIKEHQKLVYHTIKKYYPKYKDNEDFSQVGLIGLLGAIRSYDENKNIRFSTYAIKCIRNQFNQFIRDSNCNKRNPGEEVLSFEQNLYLKDTIKCDKTNYNDIDNRIFIENALKQLSKRERKVIELCLKECSYNDLQNILNLSRGVVNKIKISAYKKLREYLIREDVC